MARNLLTLSSKEQLTQDIYELEFHWRETVMSQPWQYVTFALPNLKEIRSYSIAWKQNEGNVLKFIIKRLEDGRWWSKEICDMELWKELKCVWPKWDFILNPENNNKIFIWTGTWFAPLYYQLRSYLERWGIWKVDFVFWERSIENVFYQEEIQELRRKYNKLDFKIYLSREVSESIEYYRWRVTDYITNKNIEWFDEFYLCGSPTMVEEVKEKLSELCIGKEKVFSEKY
jgi:NAD(P)H-flavin reductase